MRTTLSLPSSLRHCLMMILGFWEEPGNFNGCGNFLDSLEQIRYTFLTKGTLLYAISRRQSQ